MFQQSHKLGNNLKTITQHYKFIIKAILENIQPLATAQDGVNSRIFFVINSLQKLT